MASVMMEAAKPNEAGLIGTEHGTIPRKGQPDPMRGIRETRGRGGIGGVHAHKGLEAQCTQLGCRKRGHAGTSVRGFEVPLAVVPVLKALASAPAPSRARESLRPPSGCSGIGAAEQPLDRWPQEILDVRARDHADTGGDEVPSPEAQDPRARPGV